MYMCMRAVCGNEDFRQGESSMERTEEKAAKLGWRNPCSRERPRRPPARFIYTYINMYIYIYIYHV